jgi:hypothetical protein
MSKRKKGGKGPARGVSRSLGARAIFLLFFAIGAFVVYTHRAELLAGIEGHLLGSGKARVAASLEDLRSEGKRASANVRVKGIPDYASIVRLPVAGKMLTCFRMTGFQSRLLVCTPGSVKEPAEIADILRERAYEGKLTSLGEADAGAAIRRTLEKAQGIQVPADGWLVLDGESSLPSLGKTLALAGCAVLSFFFFCRFIL